MSEQGDAPQPPRDKAEEDARIKAALERTEKEIAEALKTPGGLGSVTRPENVGRKVPAQREEYDQDPGTDDATRAREDKQK